LNRISTFFCTSEVACRYLQLSVPSDHGIFPILANEAIQSLSRLLSTFSKFPPPLYEFSSSALPLSFPALNAQKINKDVSFVAWILLDVPIGRSSSVQPLLFSLIAPGSKSILLFFNGVSLCVQFAGPHGISSIVLTSSFSSGCWHFISLFITTIPNEPIGHLYFGFDSEPVAPFLIKNPDFSDAPVRVQIGGFVDLLPFSRPYLWLGPAKFFGKLFKGPAVFSPASIAKFENSSDFPKFNEQQPGSSLRSILDVLKQPTVANYLIPFFSITDRSSFAFLELLLGVFCFIGESINYRLIGRLMKRWKPEFLTFSIYSQFVDLLEIFASDSLLFEVAFNFSIWSNASSLHLARIVCHWGQALFPAHASVIIPQISFANLLAEIFAYFGRRHAAADHSDRITLLRHLFPMLVLHHQSNPNPQNSVYVLSYLYTATVNDELIELLKLLRALGHCDNTASLHYLFAKSDPELFCECLLTALALAPDHSGSELHVIMCHITTHHITTALFDRLLVILPSHYPVILLLAMISFFLDSGPDKFLSCISILPMTVTALTSIVSMNDWFVWIVLVTLKMPPQKQLIGVMLLHSLCCADRTFAVRNSILCFVDILDRIHAFPGRSFAWAFIRIICDIDVISASPADVILFFRR
jgi:hypothetical protein